MQALELQTTIHNGILSLTLPPEQVAQWEGKPIRVILLDDSGKLIQPIETLTLSSFKAVSLRTQGFKFDRGEANVR